MRLQPEDRTLRAEMGVDPRRLTVSHHDFSLALSGCHSWVETDPQLVDARGEDRTLRITRSDSSVLRLDGAVVEEDSVVWWESIAGVRPDVGPRARPLITQTRGPIIGFGGGGRAELVSAPCSVARTASAPLPPEPRPAGRLYGRKMIRWADQ